MVNTTFQQNVHKILTEMEDLLVRKNADYGNSFSLLMDEYGLTALNIRLSDKLNRLKQLTKEDYERQVNDESIEDTVRDILGYACLALEWVENNK